MSYPQVQCPGRVLKQHELPAPGSEPVKLWVRNYETSDEYPGSNVDEVMWVRVTGSGRLVCMQSLGPPTNHMMQDLLGRAEDPCCFRTASGGRLQIRQPVFAEVRPVPNASCENCGQEAEVVSRPGVPTSLFEDEAIVRCPECGLYGSIAIEDDQDPPSALVRWEEFETKG